MLLKNSDQKQKKEPISADCIAVCLYFLCLPFTVVTTPFGSLLKVISIPVAAFLMIRMLMGKSSFTFNYIHFSYTIYILYTVMMILMYHEAISVVTTKDMVLGLLMLLMISIRIYNEREREWMESAWIIVGVICIFLALSSNEMMNDYENRVVIRIFGFEEDQNHFCAYFIMSMLISVKRFLERRRFYPVYILIIIFSFYAILKTGSRGGLIGIMAGMAVYILFGIKSIKSRIVVALAGVLVGFVVVSVLLPNLPADVRARYSIEAVVEDQGTGRFEIWNYLLDYTASKPGKMIFGSGLSSTYDILSGAGFQNGVAHNTYIQILTDQGIIGLLLFCIVIAACLIRNAGRHSVYVCAFISLLAFSMSLSFYVFKPYLNIMMMCAMAFEKTLPENYIKAAQRRDQDDV